MVFHRYFNIEAFKTDVLALLLEEEVCNNLPLSIISDKSSKTTPDWLMGTVTDNPGQICLIVLCTKPFNMLLYAPESSPSGAGAPRRYTEDSVFFLADELRRIGFVPPGVLAESGLARCFTAAYASGTGSSRIMMLMKLDRLLPYKRAPGICRVLTNDDLSFVSLWEQEFCNDCNVPPSPLGENEQRIRTRIGRDIHYIWEDNVPVSQAVYGRETPNGAVINWVYTPPLYRGHGYATSVVAELSQSLLSRGKKFCCLFADADNKISRSIYSKLGYYDIAEFEEIKFIS